MKKIILKKKVTLAIFILGMAITAGFIFSMSGANAEGPPGGEMPPMPVKVVTAVESDAPIWTDYAGRISAVDQAEIRPQVSGVIKQIKFKDGAIVEKSDVLFVIDPAPFEAAVQQATADLAIARSQNDLAQKELERARGLLQTDAISQSLMDERANAANVAKDAVNSAQARLRQAKIDLDYAHVKAPISGRASRAEITEGNLVQAGPGAPLLTTIVGYETVYADFDVDESTYLAHVRHNKDEATKTAVRLTTRGDTGKVYEGTIDSFDNKIDVATGTVRARALFKNDDGALLPGMYVSVKMGAGANGKKIMIPERAVGTDQDRKFVYVVGADNKVQYRPIRLGASADGNRVVEEGLSSGEKIITEGIIKIRPDMAVVPQEEIQSTQETPDLTEQPAIEQTPTEKSEAASPDDNLLKQVEE
jgi:multidrug efflux system membrane fusion protein